jgi:thiamine biosynthesis protein ThiS
MHLVINGQSREFSALSEESTLADLVDSLELKGDRVAIEQNGLIVARPLWGATPLSGGDRMEIVHFVGGGNFSAGRCNQFLGTGK